jgi:hypothetical protein
MFRITPMPSGDNPACSAEGQRLRLIHQPQFP